MHILLHGSGKILGTMAGAQIVGAHPNVKKYLGFALLPQGWCVYWVTNYCAVTDDTIIPSHFCSHHVIRIGL